VTNRDADPDETEGRKLYRVSADNLAHAQTSMAARRVTMTEPMERRELPTQSPAVERAAIRRLAQTNGERRVTYTISELHALISECEAEAAAQAVQRERERWEAALICASCGGPYPNPDCGQRKNALDCGERVPCHPMMPDPPEDKT
jgi:hypothetical protein